MRDKKLQIFVSSTFTDLRDERQAAVEAILSSGHIPAGMELFSAGDETQMTVIKRWIDESDVYLLILGGRYGSVENKSKKSYTQLEYEYAISVNKPLFAIVITQKALEEKVKQLGTAVIEQEHPKELNEFKSMVLNNLVKFWEDSKDIKIAIHETLSDFIYRKDLVGWIRGDNSVNTAFLAEEIARLTKENSELRNKLIEVNSTSTALYASLSYHQLEELLKSETLDVGDKRINLFEFLMSEGKELSKAVVNPIDNTIYQRLEMFKLIYEFGQSDYRYKLTEDGHNFYLKALVMAKPTISNNGIG